MREDSKDILSKVLEAVLEVEVKDIKFLNLERNVDNIHVRRKYFDMFLDTNIGKIQVEVNADYDMSKKLRNQNSAPSSLPKTSVFNLVSV